jgi:hypothetical protein
MKSPESVWQNYSVSALGVRGIEELRLFYCDMFFVCFLQRILYH